MKKQISTTQQLLKAAYIAAPVLLAASSLTFVLGITIIPPGKTGYAEGVLGAFALMLFVPVYLDLGKKLSEQKKVIGNIALVCGLLGSVTGYGIEMLRVIEYSLRIHGSEDALWSNWYENMGLEYVGLAMFGPLFPVTSILLGYGFFMTRQIPRWTSLSLIAAGIGFPLAQVLELEWALKITYPASTILWTVSLVAISKNIFHNRSIV